MASARVLTTNELGLIRYQHALITNSWPIEVRLLPQPNDTPHTLYTLHTPGNAAASFTSTRREELRATLNVRPGALVYEVLRDGILVSTGGLEVRPPMTSPTSTSVSELRPSGARQLNNKVYHHQTGNNGTMGNNNNRNNNVVFEYNEMPWTVRQVSIVDEVTGRIVTDLHRGDHHQCDAGTGFSAAAHLPVGQFLYRFRVVLLSQPTKPTRLGWDDGAMTQAWELMTWPLCIEVNDLSMPDAVPGDGMMRLDERLLNVPPVKYDFHDDFDDDDDDDEEEVDDDDETMVDEDEEQQRRDDLDLQFEEQDTNKENIKAVASSFSAASRSSSSPTASHINSPVPSAIGKNPDPPAVQHRRVDKAGLHHRQAEDESSRQTPSCIRDASYASGYDSSFEDEDTDPVVVAMPLSPPPTKTWSPKLGYRGHVVITTDDTKQGGHEKQYGTAMMSNNTNDSNNNNVSGMSPPPPASLGKAACYMEASSIPNQMDVDIVDLHTRTATTTATTMTTKDHHRHGDDDNALSLPPPSSTMHTLASVAMSTPPRPPVVVVSATTPGGGGKADVGYAAVQPPAVPPSMSLQRERDSGSSATTTPIKVSARSGTGKKNGGRRGGVGGSNGGGGGGGRKWTGMALNAAMFLLGTTVTLVMGRNRRRAFRRGGGGGDFDDGSSMGSGSEDDDGGSVDGKQQQGDDGLSEAGDAWMMRSKSKRVSSFNVSVAQDDDDEPVSFRWRRKSRRGSDAASVRSGDAGGGSAADSGDGGDGDAKRARH